MNPHLDGSVVCPHFILDPVLLKDVHRLQKCEPLDVLRWFKPATEHEKNKRHPVGHCTQSIYFRIHVEKIIVTHTLVRVKPSSLAANVAKNS